jgi:hypothetical protein
LIVTPAMLMGVEKLAERRRKFGTWFRRRRPSAVPAE